QRRIERHRKRQVHARAQRELLLWIGRLIGGARGVAPPGLGVNALPQQVVAGVQPPPVEQLIGAAELEAVGVAFDVVLKVDRIRKDVRGRGWRRRGAAQSAVVVVEGRERAREPRGKLGAVARLIGHERLGAEARAPLKIRGGKLKRRRSVDQAARYQQITVVARRG